MCLIPPSLPLQTKCHRYWPGAECIVYGEIAVEMMSEKEKEDWTVREFKLSMVRNCDRAEQYDLYAKSSFIHTLISLSLPPLPPLSLSLPPPPLNSPSSSPSPSLPLLSLLTSLPLLSLPLSLSPSLSLSLSLSPLFLSPEYRRKDLALSYNSSLHPGQTTECQKHPLELWTLSGLLEILY